MFTTQCSEETLQKHLDSQNGNFISATEVSSMMTASSACSAEIMTNDQQEEVEEEEEEGAVLLQRHPVGAPGSGLCSIRKMATGLLQRAGGVYRTRSGAHPVGALVAWCRWAGRPVQVQGLSL